jgi:Protein of unknown function (DUF3489)
MATTTSRKTTQISKTMKPTAPSAAKTRKASAQPEAAPSAGEPPTHQQPSNDAAPIVTSKISPRPGSKLAQVIDLLQREGGAALAELNTATGWLPHTTRAALTGLRKRGMALERLCDPDGTSRYHLARAS